MEKKQTLFCDQCKMQMEEIEAQFSYLDRSFRHKVMRCKSCGQVSLSEDIVSGRMKDVEKMIEDK